MHYSAKRAFITVIVICLLVWTHAHAQAAAILKSGDARVYGKVVDSKNKKAADYASVSILAAKKDSLIAGMLTESKGGFSFENLSFGDYRIKVSYMGFKDFEKSFSLSADNPDQDLGNLTIEENTQKLNEVTVTAEKAMTNLAVDKKVFNVDRDLSSRGGNALEAMQNIPGVAVDADGNVTLRNNTPLIYVDGKPTTLSLDQIPNDQIDRIEVITNPSAKYEAAASGGIINVVMKHNTKPGYNGLISALAGTNDQYNGTASFNFHRNKIGFSLSANASGATNPTSGYDNRTDQNAGSRPTGYYNQDITKVNTRRFEHFKAGLDFYLSRRNTLSISETVVLGWFGNNINSNITSFDSTKAETSYGRNFNYEGVYRHNYTSVIDFRHSFPKKGKEYSITIQYDRQTSLTTFADTTNTYSTAGNLLPFSQGGTFKQNIPSGYQSHMLTAQWDFSHPLRDSLKLEYGIRAYYKRNNAFANTNNFLDSPAVWVSDAGLSTDFLTNETIDAAYISVSQQVKKFSYQIGLRYEEDYFSGKLLNNPSENFSYHYPSSPALFYESFFPGFYLSQAVAEHHVLQLNVTRKTNRPSGGQLNPNLEVIDQKDYTKGNVALKPEFINQGEINYNLSYPAADWLSSAYARYTENPIVGITSDSAQILLATYANGRGKFNYGWENTFKFLPVKNLNISLDVNLFYTNIQAYLPEGNQSVLLTNSGWSWTAKGMLSYKFPMGFAAQFNGSYEAPKPVPEGSTLPVYFFDLAASKEFGPLAINLGISDLLNSHVIGYNYEVPGEYSQSLSKRRQTRFAKLSISYKFGKEEKTGHTAKPGKKERDQLKEEDSE